MYLLIDGRPNPDVIALLIEAGSPNEYIAKRLVFALARADYLTLGEVLNQRVSKLAEVYNLGEKSLDVLITLREVTDALVAEGDQGEVAVGQGDLEGPG